MTVLLDQAIREMAEGYPTKYYPREESVMKEVREETWEEICEYREYLNRIDYLTCLAKLETNRTQQVFHDGKRI